MRRGWCALLLAGLVSVSLANRALAQGLVSGVMGTALSPTPGELPSQRVQGGLALRLNQEQLEGRTWWQLLASDGSHGWTPAALSVEQPVNMRATGRYFELIPVPPGHRDFLSGVGQAVPDGTIGRLLGGSRQSHVADMQDLLVPAWLSTSRAPWPLWSMGGVEGYAPLPAVALSWPSAVAAVSALPTLAAAPTAPAHPHDLLRLLGLEGLSRAPFLAPLQVPLQRFAPAAGQRALDFSQAAGKAPGQRQLQGVWQGPLAAYRTASNSADGLAALLMFGQDKARTLVLLGPKGMPMLAHVDDDALFIARLDEADLDGDGRPEWLLELVGVYGDGYYSELWVIDGRSHQQGLRIHRQALSRSSGEAPASAQDAAWWVGRDGRLWVWRSTLQGSRLSASRYTRASLSTAAVRRPALVVLGSDADAAAASQRRWQALSPTNTVQVLPHQTPTGLHWITAVPWESVSQAARWAASQGLPATAVQALPWRR